MEGGMKKTGPRACATCAKAKARCIPGSNPLKCERCHRLEKPCSQQTPAPPRVRKEPKTTRVAQLEKKLEDLLKATKVQPEDSPVRRRVKKHCYMFDIAFPSAIPEPDDDLQTLKLSLKTAESSPAGDIEKTSNTSPAYDGDSSSMNIESSWPQGDEASTLLRVFRTKIMSIFPFVILPPGMSSEQLKWERPFLWKATMLEACSTDGGRQVRLGRELLKDLTDALVTQPRKNVDLLQGLLLFLAWFNYGLNNFQVTNILGLARSLCLTMGFNNTQFETQTEHSSGCLEQMRAFAGTYYLVTTVFTTSKRPDAFMNTTYLDAICRVLEKKAEYPSDELLIRLVKIQQIAQAVSSTLSSNVDCQYYALPVIMAVKSFQTQIDEFKASLPGHLQDNSSLMAHVHIAEILVHEVGLNEGQYVAGNLQATDRLGLLWSILSAAKSFLALRFNNPITVAPRFLCISSFDFMYAFITCLKLINFQAPGWDLALVRRDLELNDLVDRQLHDIELLCQLRKRRQASNSGPHRLMTEEPDPMSRILGMLKNVRAVLRAMPEPPPTTDTGVTQLATPPSGDDIMEDLDPSWELNLDAWQELMGDNMMNSSDPNIFNGLAFGYLPGSTPG